MQKGFTLAEVLITIGIIGLVAALTFPILLKHHRKTVIETSLKKFYTSTNQAVLLSVAQNGETKDWQFPSDTPEEIENWYNIYFKKYLNTHRTGIESVDGRNYFTIYFADGTAAKLTYMGHDWYFCLNAKYLQDFNKWRGSQCFMFGFYPVAGALSNSPSYSMKNFRNKGIEPYVKDIMTDETGNNMTDENGNFVHTTEKDLYSQKAWSKIIQLNNWQIPKDYPVRY